LKVLLISTAIFPVPPVRYGGIEGLLLDYVEELANLGVEVVVAAPKGSRLPKNVKLIETVDLAVHRGFTEPETVAYYNYAHRLKDFDVIHDFSHSHYAPIRDPSLKCINMCWFDPLWALTEGKTFPMPNYNIIALSQDQAANYLMAYKHRAIYQPTICVNPQRYAYSQDKSERFLFVGKMSWHKGALEAIKFCRELGVPLNVVGAKGLPNEPDTYQNEVLWNCDDKQIVWYGNCSDEVKINLMQHAKALLYPVQYPEAHSMKAAEAMMCGCPVITLDKGAMREVVDNDVTGYVAKDDQEFKEAMKKIDQLNPRLVHEKALERYGRSKIVKNWIPLYEAVSRGVRWGKF